MNRKFSYILSLLLLCCCEGIAQFEDATVEMVIPTYTDDPYYGHGVCFVDINKDGWDDVTCCTFSNGIIAYENTGSSWIRRTIVPNSGNAKCAVYADYDRDNDLDLFVTHRFGEMRLFRNEGNWNFTDVSAESNILGFPIVATWGATWDDFNKDGWPDIFVVNYDSSQNSFNRLLKNNGDGTFTNVANDLNVQGGGTFPFMPTFFHANQDNFNDLFVCVDFSPSDRLFLGNNSGGFNDVSNICGLNFSVNNMTASPGDFDNDGDFDLFMTNTPGNGSYLYKNNGSAIFTNTTSTANANIPAWTWGATWLDYNNDANLDIAVASQLQAGESSLYLLKGNGANFQDVTPSLLKFVPSSNYAIARGDFNRDGYPDLYLNVEDGGYNRLYRNTLSGKNFVKIELEGTVSNMDGYGTRLTYYINGVKRVSQLRSGEQYLSQNSQHLILSMGTANSIDSLIINWPSGALDKYYNVPSNRHYHLIESNTSPIQLELSDSIICPGESVVLSELNGEEILWNTGVLGDSLVVDAEGVYFGYFRDSRGVYWHTDSIEISHVQTDSISYSILPPQCEGLQTAEVCLFGSDVFFVQNENQCMANLPTGISVLEINNEGCLDYLSILIPAPNFAVPEFNLIQPNCLNGYVGSVELSGGWNFSGEQVKDSLQTGLNILEANLGLCQSEISFEVLAPEVFELEVSISNPLCNLESSFGSILVEWQDLVQYELYINDLFHSSNLSGVFDSLLPGSYSLACVNSQGCSYSTSFEIVSPPMLDFQESVVHPLCHNDSTGQIMLSFEDDIILFKLFQGSEIIQSSISGFFSNLPWGVYTVEGINQNGCSVFHQIELSNPSEMFISVDTLAWEGSFPFTLVSNVEYATPPVVYNWTSNCSESSCEIFSSGLIGLEVIDANGCTDSWSWNIPLLIEDVPILTMNLNGFHLNFSEDGTIRIYNVLGEIVSEEYGRMLELKSANAYIVRFERNNGEVRFFKVVTQ